MKKIQFSMIAVVLLEIATFIIVGNQIGVLNTLLLILLPSIIGLFIAKKQGIQSFQNISNSIENGQPPGIAMIDTFLIFVGGVFFIIPGFLTDVIGLTLLIPLTRKFYKPIIIKWIHKKLKKGQFIIIQK